ncbi:hypothetical protein Syun_014807 [Stephania yunnanensis]|uniref:Uncharacterized protein n=1 Tax=Stephania yunnanensis TaxID=152371 RepID=A0AAP0JK78_9MAGN
MLSMYYDQNSLSLSIDLIEKIIVNSFYRVGQLTNNQVFRQERNQTIELKDF